MLDGEPLWTSDTSFRQVPGTNIYYALKNVSPGAHRIESETRVSSYIYGFGDYDSYGYPAGMSFDKIDEPDTLAPAVKISSNTGEFTITVSESVQSDTQKDQGISKVLLLPKRSDNVELDITPFKAGVESLRFTLRVKDLTRGAKAVFGIADRSGNIALDSMEYQGVPNSIEEDKTQHSQIMNISPNPASGSRVTVSYKVGAAAPVRIEVSNARGELIRTAVNQQMQTGIYAAIIDIADLAS